LSETPWTRPRVMVVSRCTSSYGPSKGGADVLAQRHAVLLAQDADVVYVGARPIQGEHVQNLPVRPRDLLPANGGSMNYLVNEGFHVVQGAMAAIQGERQFPVDLVVSNSSISTILLKILGRRPVVHYIHDSLYVRSDRPSRSGFAAVGSFVLNNLIEKLAIRLADKVICASQGIASQAVLAGTPESKLTVMYPLLRRLQRSGPPPTVPLQGLPVPLRNLTPYLLSVGQQTGRKRFDILIQTLRILPERYRLVLVGDGPLHDSYRAIAVARGLADRVVFLRGVDDSLLDRLYENCAAYVLASENEGFPITVAEALARGRPAVLACPSTGGLRAALANDALVVLPYLAEPAIAEAILEAIDRDTANPASNRRSISEWARHAFPTEDKIRSDYDRIIRSLLEVGPPGAPPGAGS
jgi:glycosyltransferase involved in cell wall biosynthesis